MSSGRSLFIEKCEAEWPAEQLLSIAKEVASKKKVARDRCYCTGFTNIEGALFVSMVKYWLASLVLTHETLPRVRIVYTGKHPCFLEGFPNVSLVPLLWGLEVKDKGVARFNFTMKMQSLMGIPEGLATWVDADVLFRQDTFSLTGATSFIRKSKRVAGGFYTLTREDRASFYMNYIVQLENLVNKQEHLNSDQKVMRIALRQAKIAWEDIRENIDDFFLHLSRGAVQQSHYCEAYRDTLQRFGK